ncbi:hypothetical protein [Pedobacter sp. UYP24]
MSRLAGAPDTSINQRVAFNRKYFELIMQSSYLTNQQLKNQVDTLLYYSRLNQNLNKAKFDAVKQRYESLLTPWLRTSIKLNSADYLVKVKCPVLALNGTKDMQINSQANLAGIANALNRGGNKRFKVLPLEGLNHLFQKANTGNTTEFAQISETVNPIVLTTISNWVNTLSP